MKLSESMINFIYKGNRRNLKGGWKYFFGIAQHTHMANIFCAIITFTLLRFHSLQYLDMQSLVER